MRWIPYNNNILTSCTCIFVVLQYYADDFELKISKSTESLLHHILLAYNNVSMYSYSIKCTCMNRTLVKPGSLHFKLPGETKWWREYLGVVLYHQPDCEIGFAKIFHTHFYNRREPLLACFMNCTLLLSNPIVFFHGQGNSYKHLSELSLLNSIR